jgi:hypothetical protein
VVLEAEPGEQSLQGAVGAAPTLVVEGLIPVVIVLIDTFCVVFNVFLFGLRFYEKMGVVEFMGCERYLSIFYL